MYVPASEIFDESKSVTAYYMLHVLNYDNARSTCLHIKRSFSVHNFRLLYDKL